MEILFSFHKGELPRFHLNFSEDAIHIQQYSPICLLNLSFKMSTKSFFKKKMLTKVGTNRVSDVAEIVVQPTQTTFMSGRHLRGSGHSSQVFRLNLSFVQHALRMKGYDSKWCN
jgi:hypothetical protein